MALCKAVYGKKCGWSTCWEDTRKLLGPDTIKETIEKVKLIKEHLLTAQSKQKSFVDRIISEMI